MNILDFYDENKLKVWAAILIGIPVFLLMGSLILPEIFWESFLWRYIWGPVIADTKGSDVNGIAQGYNWVNTTVYAFSLIIAASGIYELMQYFDITVDNKFVLTLLPWLVLGGSLRSLEDVGLFSDKIRPLFISPIIYLVIGISAIITMIFGGYLSRINRNKIQWRFFSLIPPILIFVIFQLKFVWIMTIVLVLSLTFFFLIGERYKWLDEKYLFLSYGTSLLSISLIYNSYYIRTLNGTNPYEVLIIPGLALTITFVILIFGKAIDLIYKNRLKRKIFSILMSPLNFLIIFAHLFDASATYRGIEFYGYIEKHVLPTLAIEFIGTSAVMFLLKLMIIFLILYVMEFLYREEMMEMRNVNNLVKFIVIVLGMSPAVRNTLRLAMGV